jgi:hypothetical protein
MLDPEERLLLEPVEDRLEEPPDERPPRWAWAMSARNRLRTTERINSRRGFRGDMTIFSRRGPKETRGRVPDSPYSAIRVPDRGFFLRELSD